MPKVPLLFKPIPTKAYFAICASVIFLIATLHVFMVYVEFPWANGAISLYVPARSGGHTFIIDVNEFSVASYIALAFAVLASIAVALLLRFKKKPIATIVMLWLVTLPTLYLATYGGNAIHEMWGTLWATIGVIAILTVGFMLELPFLKEISASGRRNTTRK